MLLLPNLSLQRRNHVQLQIVWSITARIQLNRCFWNHVRSIILKLMTMMILRLVPNLIELINLCMGDQVDIHHSSRASPVEENKMDSGRFESVYKVQCPLCGSDISDLSEEMQLAHTNNCLDKDEPAKESDHNHERGPCTGENTENECVVEWLRNLGLSKYEEIFTKEEVDWETLQWLTEEDLLGMGITSLDLERKLFMPWVN
ncbi:hypothetical protein ACQ4PT_014068 [Festuca glaucescens]